MKAERARKLPGFKSIVVWTLIVELGLLCGVEGVFLAAFASSPHFHAAYNNPVPAVWGAATAMYPVFASIGSMAVLYFGCIMAAKTMLALAVYVWLAGYLVAVFVPQVVALVAARILKGLGIGVIAAAVPLYVDRIGDRRQAARLLTAMQAAAPLGTFTGALLGSLGSWNDSFARGWLAMAAPVFPAAVFVLWAPREPSGPVHMAELTAPNISASYKDRRRLWNGNVAPGRKVVQNILLLWKTPRYRKRLFGATLAQVGWQVTGINILMYYMHGMCVVMGVAPALASHIALGLYATNFVGTAASLAIVHQLPRARTLQGSVVVMAICHGAIYLSLLTVPEAGSVSQRKGHAAVAVTGCFVFVGVFSVLFAGISLVYTSEIVPIKVRGTAIGVATAAGWIANFAISLAAPAALEVVGIHVFLVLCYGCAALFIVYVAFL